MGNPTYTKVKLTLSGSDHGMGELTGQRDSFEYFLLLVQNRWSPLKSGYFLDPLEGVARYRCVLFFFFNNNRKDLFVIELVNTFIAVVLFKSSHCDAGVLVFTQGCCLG